MHKPHDGGKEDVHLLRQEQGFPGYDYFGDGNQGKVKGLGKIAITSEHSISNVFLVVTRVQPPVYKSIVPHGLQLFVYKC